MNYAGPSAWGSGSRSLTRLTALAELECTGKRHVAGPVGGSLAYHRPAFDTERRPSCANAVEHLAGVRAELQAGSGLAQDADEFSTLAFGFWQCNISALDSLVA